MIRSYWLMYVDGCNESRLDDKSERGSRVRVCWLLLLLLHPLQQMIYTHIAVVMIRGNNKHVTAQYIVFTINTLFFDAPNGSHSLTLSLSRLDI
jgi:hypothetical protein